MIKNSNLLTKETTDGLLLQIPRAKNYVTYDKNERKLHWLEKALKFIAMTNTNNTSNTVQTVTSWLLKTINKTNPTIFANTMIELGFHVVHQMYNIEAAAMWTKANISMRAARIILSHLNLKFKHRVQVPLTQLDVLGNINNRLQPIF